MPLLPSVETLVTAQGDGTALTAAARNSAIPAAALFTIPPNFFDVFGKQMLIKASGRITTDQAAPGTARWDINFLDSAAANVIVFDSLAVPLDNAASADATNVGWWLEILLTCRAIGPTGSLFGQGQFTSANLVGITGAQPKASLTAMLPWNSAPAVGATFNTTLAQQIDLRWTQTVTAGTPANSMTLHQYSVIRLN